MIVREPVVAGMFYNLHPDNLKEQIKHCFEHPLGPGKTKESKFLAAVVPHAGYAYSGPVAAWVYAKIPKANYLILGPNHGLFGSNFATMKGIWKTPLGDVKIDERVAEKLVEMNPLIELDILAHQQEHSIEVQLPFLQYRFKNFKFVPLCVANQFPDFDFLEQCQAVGKTIAAVLKKQKEKWIIIASSDFTHYQPYEYAVACDKYYIEAIEKLDEKDFFVRLQEKHASVCGFGPIAIAMIAAKQLGAKKGTLLKYATSGDVTHDKGAVVGYASIVMK
jgi:hypothetical protein